MQKHVATFTKKNKEKNCEKGGGVTKISTWLIRGVIKMSTFVYEGGGGVKKVQKTVHVVCACPLIRYIIKKKNH